MPRVESGEDFVFGALALSRVLIVDDQLISRMILEQLIRSIGNDTEAVSFDDPIKALEWAKQDPPDLVLTDLKMPNMNGVEFTQWLRNTPTCVDVPIIIITCMDDDSTKYRALEAGATDFLTKPIDHHECRARCRNLLRLREQQVIIRDRARWLEKRSRPRPQSCSCVRKRPCCGSPGPVNTATATPVVTSCAWRTRRG